MSFSFTFKRMMFFLVSIVFILNTLVAAADSASTTDSSKSASNPSTTDSSNSDVVVSDEDNPIARTSDLTVLGDLVDEKIKRTVNSNWTINISGYGALGFIYSQRALKANTTRYQLASDQYNDGAYYFKIPVLGLSLKGKLREDPIKDGDLSYAVGLTFSGTSVSIADLNLTWNLISTKRGEGLPFTFSITAGQFLIPFSSDNLAGEDKKPTINNAQYYTTWKLGRDIGFKFDEGFFNTTDVATGIVTPKINLSIAVVNGSGANVLDSLRNKDFVSKIIFSPVQSYTNILGQLSFGGSVLLKNIDYFDNIVKFPIRRYTTEINWLKQPFLFTGEYVYGDTTATSTVKVKNSHNRVASKGLVLTAFYNDKPLTHWQPLFRYDYFDPNDVNNADHNRWYTIGLNTFIYQTHPSVQHDYDVVASTRVVKIQTNYTFKQEAKNKKVKNNELGLQAYFSF